MSERGKEIYCKCGYSSHSNEPCDICAQIVAAYKRGREDAAQAVKDLAASHGDSDWALTVHSASIAHGIELALIAARGGEQK